jgi:hypothetical protein
LFPFIYWPLRRYQAEVFQLRLQTRPGRRFLSGRAVVKVSLQLHFHLRPLRKGELYI